MATTCTPWDRVRGFASEKVRHSFDLHITLKLKPGSGYVSTGTFESPFGFSLGKNFRTHQDFPQGGFRCQITARKLMVPFAWVKRFHCPPCPRYDAPSPPLGQQVSLQRSTRPDSMANPGGPAPIARSCGVQLARFAKTTSRRSKRSCD